MFDNYAQYEYYLVAAQLVFVMLGMGATLTLSDFLILVKEPRGFLLYTLFYLVVFPILAVVTVWTAQLETGIALGLILMAVMPGGSLTNVFTLLSHGKVALSIAISACSTLASIVAVPVLMRLFASEVTPNEIRMPVVEILRDVFCYLLTPLAIGMIVGAKFPANRETISKWCLRIGVGLVLAVLVGSLVSGRLNPTAYGWKTPLVIAAFVIVSQQLSFFLFRLIKLPGGERMAVGMELTVRNMNLALLLNANLFPDSSTAGDPVAAGVLFVILVYGAASVAATIPVILIRRLFAKKPEPQQKKAAPVRPLASRPLNARWMSSRRSAARLFN